MRRYTNLQDMSPSSCFYFEHLLQLGRIYICVCVYVCVHIMMLCGAGNISVYFHAIDHGGLPVIRTDTFTHLSR